jgi:hypothetical protein
VPMVLPNASLAAVTAFSSARCARLARDANAATSRLAAHISLLRRVSMLTASCPWTEVYGSMLTLAPLGTRANKATISAFFMRIHPCEAGIPIESSSAAPWM